MTTRRRIRQIPLAEAKKLRDELEQQLISFDMACALPINTPAITPLV